MPPFRPWAELPQDLLCRVGDILDLKYYSSARGACTAWRCALAPPTPSLLVVLDDAMSAASLLTRRSFELKAVPSGARCVGSSNGWLALSFCIDDNRVQQRLPIQIMFSLFNPLSATDIVLPPLFHRSSQLSKLVFAPNPARDDFAAAAICDIDRLAYVTAGARRWAVLGPVRLAGQDRLADVAYHGKDRVHCLTWYGDVHVLRISERRCCDPVMVDDPSSVPAISAHSSYEQCLRRSKKLGVMLRRRSVGPDLNARASLEPLLSIQSATNFAQPYNEVLSFTSAKNLVFIKGNLYQIWRNASCTVTLQLPRGGHRRVAQDEVFILRYYPRRQPCWVPVTNLGGYSVFLGKNNTVSMCAEDAPGLKGNHVYWIGGRGRDQGMVFDMATTKSTTCLPAAARQSSVCWYFLNK
ncbi:unnamed protein product [Alopecurus aequalis]